MKKFIYLSLRCELCNPFRIMNKVQFIQKFFQKKKVDVKTKLKIIKCVAYTDQELWEIIFEDSSIFTIYPNTSTCTCTYDVRNCVHAKAIMSTFKFEDEINIGKFKDKDIARLPPFEFACELGTDKALCNNGECIICMEPFEYNTKFIKCSTCLTGIHKSCWKLWEAKRPIKLNKYKVPEVDQDFCIHCSSFFEQGVRDNRNQLFH